MSKESAKVSAAQKLAESFCIEDECIVELLEEALPFLGKPPATLDAIKVAALIRTACILDASGAGGSAEEPRSYELDGSGTWTSSVATTSFSVKVVKGNGSTTNGDLGSGLITNPDASTVPLRVSDVKNFSPTSTKLLLNGYSVTAGVGDLIIIEETIAV